MTTEARRAATRTPVIHLGEYDTVRLGSEQLTEADRQRLLGIKAKKRPSLRESANGWTLKAGSTVGVLSLERIRLVLEPKFAIPGSRLISWLCYAQGVPLPHEATARKWLTGSDGYTDPVLPALLAECEALLREGLRRDYVRTDLLAPTLRGRLDVRAQATRRFGAVDRLHVRTFERDVRTWENLVCGAALSAAVPRAENPALARAFEDLARQFPRPRLSETAVRMLARARYTRLNARYRPAHAWARLVLGGSGGVTDLLVDRGHRADSLLIDMEVLWEGVVRRMVEDASGGRNGTLVPATGDDGIITTGQLGERNHAFDPDVLLKFGSPLDCHLPVDAKYKMHTRENVSAADRHQLLTYIAGYTPAHAPYAILVHPGVDGASRRTLRVRGPRGLLGVIEVLGIDTRLDPAAASVPLREVIADFARAAGEH